MNLLRGEDRADEDDHGSVLGVVGSCRNRRKPPESPAWVAATEKACRERERSRAACGWRQRGSRRGRRGSRGGIDRARVIGIRWAED